ncbi:MAG TPA: chemotaxis protein CheW [Kofleriaceae bacterium]|nr:chemotaxis protein CheW [Kofleriaceae bacterium]
MSELGDSARSLRDAFDRAFAKAASSPATAHSDFLAIRAGGQPRAIALAEIGGLHVDRRVTAIPTPVAGLLGLVGLRGVMVPLYDLRVLLGTNPVDEPRWMVTAAAAPVGFAFDGFDGHLRLDEADVARGPTDLVVAGGVTRPVISLVTLIAELERRIAGVPSRET